MPTDENDPRLIFVDIATATTPPPGLIEHFKDYAWLVHPTKGVMFYKDGSPLCNRAMYVVERFILPSFPWAEVRLIPSVYRRINPKDYVDLFSQEFAR